MDWIDATLFAVGWLAFIALVVNIAAQDARYRWGRRGAVVSVVLNLGLLSLMTGPVWYPTSGDVLLFLGMIGPLIVSFLVLAIVRVEWSELFSVQTRSIALADADILRLFE